MHTFKSISGIQLLSFHTMTDVHIVQQVTAGNRVVTVGYSRLQPVTEWLRWVTAGYSRLPSGYIGLQQITEWLPSGLQQVTAGYRVVTVGYSRLQQVTEWLQWVTADYRVVTEWVRAGYSRLPSGYSGYIRLQQVGFQPSIAQSILSEVSCNIIANMGHSNQCCDNNSCNIPVGSPNAPPTAPEAAAPAKPVQLEG